MRRIRIHYIFYDTALILKSNKFIVIQTSNTACDKNKGKNKNKNTINIEKCNKSQEVEPIEIMLGPKLTLFFSISDK